MTTCLESLDSPSPGHPCIIAQWSPRHWAFNHQNCAQFRQPAHQNACHLYASSAPTRCTACPCFLLSFGPLCSGRLSTSHAVAHCRSPIWVFNLSSCACPSYARSNTCRPPPRVAVQSPLDRDRAPGLRNQMLYPHQTVQHSLGLRQGNSDNLNGKMLQTHQSTKYTCYIAGVGPLRQQLERGPHYSTNNVQ